ncbi:histidine phosphatase family protein [Oceanimonas baumannii]|uniref:histidine phosphatase family protein n=1 Tax=Oceanimonas baumannii TaxID=129578 RepID=UPI001D17D702|nr:histidine phosphatase family protein [Oceanimonas baumannii]MCC4263867.1 histidine phosphatase family protein [Oceanimonas baumannii]
MTLYIWRHPRPLHVQGLCLGHTDAPAEQRKLKRLAGQIQRFARRHRLPKVIYTSPLQRAAGVGTLLAAQGWQWHSVTELKEINFGHWDGRPWNEIEKTEIDAWCNNFAGFAPTGGESLQQLFGRVSSWLSQLPDKPVLAVGHAGWMNAARLLAQGHHAPDSPSLWPASVAYRQQMVISVTPS